VKREPNRKVASPQAVERIHRLIAALPPAALPVLSPLLGELSAVADAAKTEKQLRQWARRTYCLLRCRQLRRAGNGPKARMDAIVAQINREAATIDPGWRCSKRSLQDWQQAWNAIGVDGLAMCVRGLLHPQRREMGRTGSGRRSRRSSGRVRRRVERRSTRV
jgi:hypothetical protein